MTYVCPTECDPGCTAPCHEAHQPDHKRRHPVAVCEDNVTTGKPRFPGGWYRNPDGCPCARCEEPYEPTWAEFIRGEEYQLPRPPMPDPEKDDDANVRIPTRMMLCRVCGNKRCPAAVDHDNVCHGSNEPGQEGSRYPAPPPERDEELKNEVARREHYLAHRDDPKEWGE